MRSKERLLEEIENLSTSNILRLYDLAITLKENEKPKQEINSEEYMNARQALKNCSGSLSEDILEERHERI